MSGTSKSTENMKEISTRTNKTLEDIMKRLKQILRGKRDIMYSDIINFIIRKGYFGENYRQIIIWCNYKIRLGKSYVEFG
jgi:hypothetical protein